MSTQETNRRRFPRFTLQPMYTPVSVHLAGDNAPMFEGHAYDISEGGIMFELDRPIAPGTSVYAQVTLPAPCVCDDDPAETRSIMVQGNVVWTDDSEPGPVRMALAISRFARHIDRERLLRAISTGRLSRRAA